MTTLISRATSQNVLVDGADAPEIVNGHWSWIRTQTSISMDETKRTTIVLRGSNGEESTGLRERGEKQIRLSAGCLQRMYGKSGRR